MLEREQDYIKLWFLQILAPFSFSFTKPHFENSFELLIAFFVIILISFAIYCDKNKIKKIIYILIPFFFIMNIIYFVLKKNYLNQILVSTLFILPFFLFLKINTLTKFKIYFFLFSFYIFTVGLALIPYYLIQKDIDFSIIAISSSYAFFFMPFKLFNFISEIRLAYSKIMHFIIKILYLLAFIIIIIPCLFGFLQGTLLLIFIFAYYAFLTIKYYSLEKEINKKIWDRAFNLAVYSWIFYMLYLIGSNSYI